MIDSPAYSGTGSASSDQTHTLFGQTMGYVAATAGFFALGAFPGRLRRFRDIDSAPLMAASIFLDALNVFQFFLQIFSRNDN
jgi:hypothetical protein